jgi:hypothetical protein
VGGAGLPRCDVGLNLLPVDADLFGRFDPELDPVRLDTETTLTLTLPAITIDCPAFHD